MIRADIETEVLKYKMKIDIQGDKRKAQYDVEYGISA